MKGKRLKKIIISTGVTIIVLVVLIIAFISPLAKYLVEKYDEKILGRQITLDWAYVNPLTGYVHLSNAKVYEANSDTLFFSSSGISANFSMHKLLSKTIEINDLILDKPFGVICQDTSKKLNFSDIIKRFSPKARTNKTKRDPTKFNMLNVVINDGVFVYRDLAIPVNYPIKHVNIKSTGFRWDSDTISGNFDFVAGIGTGSVKGSTKINIKNLDYQMATVFNKYDLKFIEQYLKDLINYGTFTANMDADIQATGNFRRAEDLIAKGLLAINDFHFGKNKNEDYASFKKFAIHIYELSPKNKKYDIDSVSLDQPFLKYERYDHLDNLQAIFGRKGTKVSSAKGSRKFNLIFELADYIVKLSKNFLKSDYKVNRFAIYKGNLLYNDYKLSEKVSIGIRPFYIVADSINKNDERVKLDLRSGLNPYGDIAIHVSVNPKDSSDFDMNYRLQKIPATLFNPYLVNYTSFPLNRGTIEITGNWHVRNGVIRSTNRLLVIDPRIAKRVHRKDVKWLPLPLIMAIVRERANVIDYDIPINGNLKKPKFNWKDVITDALKNMVIKPVTTPYNEKVKKSERAIEKTIYVKWQMQQADIYRSQEKFLNKISDFLEEHPESSIDVYPQSYEEKEKEYILFYEAKKKYFLHSHKKTSKDYTDDDSSFVANMSIKDSTFFHYVTKYCNDGMLFTIQDKCERYIGKALVNKRYTQLLNTRKNAFLSVFKENGTANRVKIHANENSIPYNGFSFFKIAYKGEKPEILQEAYEEMDKLNDETPRSRYSDVRKKIKQMFGKKPK
ncbi:MAG: DUF748 domain-containing protein [Bacteroidetes bacterium]|nr:DUF748 domain-containing protein [Bacteroidota bacterium]